MLRSYLYHLKSQVWLSVSLDSKAVSQLGLWSSLCGACMFLLCLLGFAVGPLVSLHSTKAYIIRLIEIIINHDE